MDERTFAPWVHTGQPAFAVLADGFPPAIEPVNHKLVFGESATADLEGTEIVFDLSPDGGVKLADSVPNTSNLLVVSERLRALLAASGERIEFHPAKIRNLKGRLVKDPYFIANPIGWVDCMDRAKSDFEESNLMRGQVSYFRRLVLDLERIPKDRKLFRLATMKELVLARNDLAHEIRKVHECEGLLFQRLDTFGQEFR